MALFLGLAVRGGIPRSPRRDDWEVLTQLLVLLLVGLGGLLAVRFRGLGASIITLGAIALGVLASLEHPPLVALGIALVFYVPGLLFWLSWQRSRSLGAVVALAGLMAALLAGGGYAASRVYDAYFGPVQPRSATAAPASTAIEWVWSGGVTETSATVVARLTTDGEARLAVATSPDFADVRLVGPVEADLATNWRVVRFEIDGLTPDTRYSYAIERNGVIDRDGVGRFWTFAVGPMSFTFAFGSCSATGSDGVVFDTIREAEPLFFLATGDFFYGDIGVNDRSRYQDAYQRTLTSAAQGALYRSAPIAYVWDDHDYGVNDADASSPGKEAAESVFRELVPHYALPAGEEAGPVYQAFTIGRVRFILTDGRAARSPSAMPDGPNKTMLGAEQKVWFKSELLAAKDRDALIVWVTTVPWIQEADATKDGWGAYATERQELADFVVANGLTERLLMLSGDAHMLAIDDGTNSDFSTNRAGGFPVMHAGALDRHGDVKGGPYSEGTYPGGGQFGYVAIVDNGATIDVMLSGRNWRGDEVVSHRFTVRQPT